MEKLRFYTNNIGSIKENEAKSLNKAIELAKEFDDIDEITILIHKKSNTGYLERTLGNDKITGLFNGQFIAFDGGPRVKVETTRTINDDNKKRILLSFGLTSEELFKYDKFYSVAAIVGHQWLENGLKDWAESWGAEEVITGTKPRKKELLDQVVKNAFDDLSESINMKTGILHPMDEEQCKTYLRSLYKYGYHLNEKNVFSYLVTEKGWESDYANDVIKLISKLNSGGHFKGGSKTDLHNYIKRWKS
jgi:hypothetical protein